MRSLGKNGESLILDYCLGLTSRERTAQVEAFIACSERAAAIHARIQAALGPLESLHPEPCPEELAGRTVRCLCAMAQEAQAAARTKTTRLRLHYPEDFRLCLSSNIPMKPSS
jgi:anti-sigma-K factor RskA